MQIEMTIKGLMVDPITNMPIVILRDKDGQQVLPIWVGHLRGQRHRAADREHRDAAADDARPAAQRHPRTSRPRSQKIVVCDLQENTFYALIYLTLNGDTVAIDARPSDAIALALRTRAPIFVEETVIDNAKTVDFSSEKADAERLQKWLESLDPGRARQVQDVGRLSRATCDRQAHHHRRFDPPNSVTILPSASAS